MRALLYISAGLLFFSQCSPIPGDVKTSGDIAGEITADGKTATFCKGDECCSEHKDCTRICSKIFYKSDKNVKKQCRSLPKDSVTNMEKLLRYLRSPVLASLEYLNVSEEFRLLLALDYKVLVRIVKAYTVDEARILLHYFGANTEPSAELLLLPEEARNEIIYEALSSAGDRSLHGSVEKGLARKISFDQSFFQLMIGDSNYDILQITHEMIKEDICSVQYVGSSHTENCVLRIYCKEKARDEYTHSEDLRNEMARNIKDEDFFKYVEEHILHADLGIRFTEPTINNDVCRAVCNDGNRSCE